MVGKRAFRFLSVGLSLLLLFGCFKFESAPDVKRKAAICLLRYEAAPQAHFYHLGQLDAFIYTSNHNGCRRFTFLCNVQQPCASAALINERRLDDPPDG